jgi:hypothetical protein
MNIRNIRQLHRKIAPIIFLPLLLSALTGVSYRIGKSWFGLSEEFGDAMMFIHQGTWLGSQLRPFYVLLNALGAIGMIITGIIMSGLFFGRSKPSS